MTIVTVSVSSIKSLLKDSRIEDGFVRGYVLGREIREHHRQGKSNSVLVSSNGTGGYSVGHLLEPIVYCNAMITSLVTTTTYLLLDCQTSQEMARVNREEEN